MKLFLFVLLVPMFVFANYFPVGKVGAKTVYVKKSHCESIESQSCFDVSGKDMRRWKVVSGVLVIDSAGDATADVEDAAKAAEQSTRDTKKSERLANMAACVTVVNGAPAMTPSEIKDCLNILIKDAFEPSIDPVDL